MGSGAGETSASMQDVRNLLEQINKLCGKIHAAKKETLQLAGLCDILGNRLSDRSLNSQQYSYDDIKSILVKVEKQLTEWSKFNRPKSLLRKAHIEAGVTGFVGELEAIFKAIQYIPSSSHGNQGTHPPDHGSVDGTPPRERESEDIASSGTGTGHNAVEADEAPPVKRLDGGVTISGDIAFGGGMYCEVWVGQWMKGGGEKTEVEKVALKTLRTLKPPEVTLKRFEHELSRWADLRHQNILQFYGIVTDIGPRLYMVSPWQEKGNLLAYVKETPQPDKNYLLRGSAAGLSYLHSRSVVHGSVKCKNVLVSQEGEPQICDFGIARISEEVNESGTSKTVSSGDTVRYSAPELIESNNVSATTHSDAYSFAMLILECITEEVPFSNLSRDAAVIHARISKRQCPPRPDGRDGKNRVSDDLWELMMRCWTVRPDQRPTMEQVHSFFLHQV